MNAVHAAISASSTYESLALKPQFPAYLVILLGNYREAWV
jgi:hypothetical protein